jgi:hypothetical protein
MITIDAQIKTVYFTPSQFILAPSALHTGPYQLRPRDKSLNFRTPERRLGIPSALYLPRQRPANDRNYGLISRISSILSFLSQ